MEHRAGEGQALAHPLAVAIDPLLGPVDELEKGQELIHPPGDAIRGHAVEFGVDRQVLPRGQPAVEGRGFRPRALH